MSSRIAFTPTEATFKDRKTPYGFNNYRIPKKIQDAYKIDNCKIDAFWNDVLYSEEEEESVGEGKSRYKRKMKTKNK